MGGDEEVQRADDGSFPCQFHANLAVGLHRRCVEWQDAETREQPGHRAALLTWPRGAVDAHFQFTDTVQLALGGNATAAERPRMRETQTDVSST